MAGKLNPLFSMEQNDVNFLALAKDFAKKHLYQSEEAEKNELAGYRIISSLLDSFSPLLKLRRQKFSQLAIKKYVKNTEIERRLFNKLPKKYVDVYINEVRNNKGDALEWFYRSHLIVDYVAGMTDDYALETYRNLMGISLS